MPKLEKVGWYRKHKEAYYLKEKAEKLQITVQTTSTVETGIEGRARVHWKPFTLFHRDMKVENPTCDLEDVKREWRSRLMDKNHPKKMLNNIGIVGKDGNKKLEGYVNRVLGYPWTQE